MATFGPVSPAGWTAADYANFGDGTYFDMVSGATYGLYVDDSDYQTYGSAIRFTINLTGMLSVTSATLTLDRTTNSYSSNGANGTIRIKCEDTVSAAAFASGTNPWSRTYRAAYVDYAFPLADDDVSIDITSLVADLFATYGAGTWTVNVSFGANTRFSTGTAVSWRCISGSSSGPAPTFTVVGTTDTGVTVTADAGAATGVGSAATIRQNVVVLAGPGAATGVGSAAGVGGSQTIVADAGAATGVGNDAGILTSAGSLSIGSHAMAYIHSADGDHTKTTAPVTTTNGSYIVAFCAVGTLSDNSSNPPTDTYSNVFAKIASDLTYSPDYPDSGISVYGKAGAAGGSGYQMTKTIPAGYEETFAFVEVVGGAALDGAVQAVEHNAANSISITTTGPAALVVMISGWGYETAAPSVSAGWTIVEDYAATSNSIQMAVAVQVVDAADTYTCTFDLTPDQYANLIAVAISGATAVTVMAEPGAATGVGSDAGVTLAQTVGAGAGAATGAGQDAGVTAAQVITADAGTATGVGSDAGLSLGWLVAADAGAATGVGSDAGVLLAQLVVAGSGSAAGAGQSAGVLDNAVVVAGSGSATGAGQDATISAFASTVVVADPGGAVGVGSDVGVLGLQVVVASAGAATGIGQDAGITDVATSVVVAESGVATGVGSDAGVLSVQLVAAESGSATGVGQDATISDFAHVTVVADPGTATGTGLDAGIFAQQVVVAGLGTATGVGYSALITVAGAPVIAGWRVDVRPGRWAKIVLG